MPVAFCKNLITAPVIDGLPLAEGEKKVRKWSQVNQERPFEFTMNTSTWFKKCFNQDFIFCKYVLSSEYELFISMTPFWARFSSGMKRCPTFPASFQGFLWFTSMTLEESGFGIWGLAEALFSYRWFRCMKVWSSHCVFADIFFLLIPETIIFF